MKQKRIITPWDKHLQNKIKHGRSWLHEAINKLLDYAKKQGV